jgi:hypothetical protein
MVSHTAASCECGYTVNDTSASSYALFTEAFETDFLHLDSTALEWDERNETGWSWQVYNVTPIVARGPYGKDMEARNVIVNPMKSQYDWAGPTELGGVGGLQLWARAKETVSGKNKFVPGSEITTLNADMMYGSYRIGVKMTGEPGTCGSFFWFRNNSMEIDLEYLSRQQSPNATSKAVYHPINLVNQSPESLAAGFNAAGTPGFDTHPLPFDPAAGFHDYRFDWTPDRISFYADGRWLRDMTQSTPDGPGRLFVNHWSNGDPAWSGGPPAKDALMTISYIKAYYNSSDAGTKKAFAARCGEMQADKTCRIPDQEVAPDQGGSKGNETAKTFFFSPPRPKGQNNGGGQTGGRQEGIGSRDGRVLLLSAMLGTMIPILVVVSCCW